MASTTVDVIVQPTRRIWTCGHKCLQCLMYTSSKMFAHVMYMTLYVNCESTFIRFYGLTITQIKNDRIDSPKNNYWLTEKWDSFLEFFFFHFFCRFSSIFFAQYLRPIHCHGHGLHTRLSQYFPNIWRWHTKFFWVEEKRTLKKGKYRGYTVGSKSYTVQEKILSLMKPQAHSPETICV